MLKDFLSDFEKKAGTILPGATIFIFAKIRGAVQELSNQVKEIGLDLYAVETCFQRVFCRSAEVGYRPANLLFTH